MEEKFPDGITSYLETYFEVVAFIVDDLHAAEIGVIADTQARQGTGGLYELAEKWADEFTQLYKGREWDGDFFDTIEDFLIRKNKL